VVAADGTASSIAPSACVSDAINGDGLLADSATLEACLYRQECELFGLAETIILYSWTTAAVPPSP
jgi:hypothetical protein